ncbi:MAG: cation-translocating P-type ATPase, partial [Actinobacteria bacterium]|nr:cation-translocating P-type ATPase [Actinomycetota bacterium]
MHCAGCAATVERAVGAIGGVGRASVSFATKRLSVEFDPAQTDLSRIGEAVAKAGFALEITRDPGQRQRMEEADERALRRRLAAGAVLTVPLVAIAMSHGAVPWLAGSWAPWAQFALATPVVLWSGGSIHRAAFARLRARGADMNVLVSLGTLVAYFSSAWSVVAGAAGVHASGHGAGHGVTFEAAAVIVVFVLLGRLLEAR